MLRIYYYLKSLIVSKDEKKILKNPKEVMKYIVFIWVFYLLLSMKFNLPYCINYILFFFLFITYCWKRKVDGDYKYWYYKKTGKREYEK